MEKVEILLCQNELSAAVEFERRLDGLGHVVTAIASSGMDALDFAQRLRPDLALIQMRIDGEFNAVETAAILARKFNIPSIYLIDPSDLKGLDGTQMSDGVSCIIEPSEDDELRANIELGLSLHRKHEELISNLDWHRMQLDASLACIETLLNAPRSSQAP